MEDYRGELCIINEEYVAKCIIQNFLTGMLTFEVEPNGDRFELHVSEDIEIYKQGNLTFDDVKHRLPKLK